MFKIKLLAGNLAIILLSVSGLVVDYNYDSVLAQTETFDPLITPQKDPLLPPSNLERELSPLEKKRIKIEIAALEVEANNQLEQGNQKQAFKLWFRQLRLYRAINPLQEIIALGKVGQIAWQANQRPELKVITRRLNIIDEDLKAEKKFPTELLIALGTSYQQVRDLNSAIAIYHTLLTQVRQENNLQLKQQYLETLGKLYLNKFDYSQAAIIYQKLVTFVKIDLVEQPEKLKNYLSKLIKIYNYTKQPKQAILVKEELVDYYLSQGQNNQIASIKIALGDDYQSLDKIELAVKSYQEAVTLGQSWQQIALVTEALQKLGDLYQKQEQYALAIETYQNLINAEMLAYNYYGVMNGYDRLGQLYYNLKDYNQALMVLTQGLNIAQSINYQVSYFTDFINKVKAKIQ